MIKVLRIAEVACIIVGSIFFGVSWTMGFWIFYHMPTQPDAARGFTIPMIVYGHTIYATVVAYILDHALFWAGLGLAFCGGIIEIYKDPFNRHSIRR